MSIIYFIFSSPENDCMKKFLCVAAFVVNIWNANAQAPSGYYNSAANKTCAALKTALKVGALLENDPQIEVIY